MSSSLVGTSIYPCCATLEISLKNLVGSFRPFVEGARDQSLAGQQALTSGLQFLQPEAILQFQNPFQQQVIDEFTKESQRQFNISRQNRAAQALAAGAFGGGREGVLEAEAQRGFQDRLGSGIANLLLVKQMVSSAYIKLLKLTFSGE